MKRTVLLTSPLSRFKWATQYFCLLIVSTLITACDSQESVQQVSYNERIDPVAGSQPAEQKAIYKFAMLEGSAEDRKAQQVFINYLSRSSGYSFKLVSFTNYTRLIEQLGDDEVQFALSDTVNLIPAISEYGIQPMARVTLPLHRGDIQAYFVVPPNSPLTKLSDIKGRSLAVGDKNSLSNTLIPLATLASKNILLPELGQLSYSSSNKQCINAIMGNTADVCAVSAAFAKPYIQRGQVRILGVSAYYPNNSVANNLYVEEVVKESVLEALLQLTLVHKHLSLTNSVIPDKFLPINAKDYTPLSDAFIRLKLNELGE